MANRAYAALWLRDLSDDEQLTGLERFLRSVPFSRTRQGFQSLVIRAVAPGETPLAYHDLRPNPATSLEVVGLAREYASPDAAFEVEAYWDLWVRDSENGAWSDAPQKLEIIAQGLDYDDGAAAEAGNFVADMGFEHLFTGHAHLLVASAMAGAGGGNAAARHASEPQHPMEAKFLEDMSRPEALREYREKTCENIRRLMDWVRAAETTIPAERGRLWSEGEENFEALLDEILSAR
jgi:hypothetical protein